MISQMKWMELAVGAVMAATMVAAADEVGADVEVPAADGDSAAEVESGSTVVDDAGVGEAADDSLKQLSPAQLVTELGADRATKRNAAGDEVERRFVDSEETEALVDELLACYQKSNDPEQWERARGWLVVWVVKYSDFGPNYGFLGVQHRLVIYPTSDGTTRHAVRVDRVVVGAAADKAGLQVADRILQIDDVDLNSAYGDLTFYRYIFNRGGGRQVALKVLREGEGEIELSAVLGRQRREHFRNLAKESRSANEVFRDWLESRDVSPR